MFLAMTIHLGRDICGNLEQAESREWLVANGIGGFASGTISGLLTRRYHGLLIAALKPPLGRTLLLNQLDEMVEYNSQFYPLYTNRWADGAVAPRGFQDIESFHLEDAIPRWTFACGDALLDKRVWMQQGENTTYVRYTVRRASSPLVLSLKVLVNYRDYHGETQEANWQTAVNGLKQGICIRAFPDAVPFYIFADVERDRTSQKQRLGIEEPRWMLANNWYRGFDLAQERYRGLRDREDRLYIANLELMLKPGDSLTIVASTESNPNLTGKVALQERQTYEESLIQRWHERVNLPAKIAPQWIEQLVLAADRFIVNRTLPDEPNGKTIIAGYPWFGDWGRDTMISLPGLTLATGRPEIARTILRTFSYYLDRGMLPNLFPEAGDTPMYNTVDATLWYFEAIRAYHAATADKSLLEELFPKLAEIIDWHCRGTRHNICWDSRDGLLYAGEEGVQLTWMDAKVGNWVVTPRIGKPVEVNALWYNALLIMADFARKLGKSDRAYIQLAEQTRQGFQRFWQAKAGYCYDVLDSPTGDDAALRPNQIFAVSLPTRRTPNFPPLLTPTKQRRMVARIARSLLTSYGLRSLSPNDPNYQGTYGGNPVERDRAYHQGTVWGWLLGHFVQAHQHAYNDRAMAKEFLEPMKLHLNAACVGNLSEIFDGNSPMTPRGAIAQAWTVAEVLRVWLLLNED
nr:amylo-alpha-1,6-glucosidase [Lusitaniella coriacea]